MQLLVYRQYTYETQHPPVARVMASLPLYLRGIRYAEKDDRWHAGDEILKSGDYRSNLALARLGVLPFFVITCAFVYAWTRRIAGDAVAFLAVLIFSTIPPVLAHAGLATTDMAATAAVTGASFMFLVWREHPSLGRSFGLGAILGVALLTKYSVWGFVFASFLIVWILSPRPGRKISPQAIVAVLLTTFVVMWACFGFTSSSVLEGDPMSAAKLAPALARIAGTRLPLGQVPAGLAQVARHLSAGQPSYFMGEVHSQGSYLFFPTAFLLKTPIPVLILLLAGAFALVTSYRQKHRVTPAWIPVLLGAAILLICIPSRLNLGLRHMLPIYPMVAIASALGAIYLLERKVRLQLNVWLVLGLLALQLAGAWAAHPNYLRYFNALAGNEPERLIVDSDFDWGQDTGKLAEYCREHGVKRISVALLGHPDYATLGMPETQELPPFQRISGTIAIGESRFREGTASLSDMPDRGAYSWLMSYQPVAVINRTIRVYEIP